MAVLIRASVAHPQSGADWETRAMSVDGWGGSRLAVMVCDMVSVIICACE